MKTLIILLFAFNVAFGGNPFTVKTYIEKTGKEPLQFIVEKFKQKDYIVINNSHKLKHEFEFVASLLPILCKEGLVNLVLEFGNAADQSKMDQLINNSDFNNDLAIELMRNYRDNGIWGYQEYLDLLKEVWTLNRTSNTVKLNVILVGNSKKPIEIPNKSLVIVSQFYKEVLNFKSKNTYSILFHTAAEREMDSAYNLLSSKNPVAIDIADSPAEIKCDGYIFLKPYEEFEPLTWINTFIDESYIKIVKEYFKHLNIETIEYATELCKAQGWVDYEVAKGMKAF